MDMSQLTDPIAALGAFGVSLVLGLVKSKTMALDGWIGAKIKPVQPLLVYAGAFALPLLTAKLGIGEVDPGLLVAAPTATIAAVTAREVLARVKGK